jgi:hypothetical protein
MNESTQGFLVLGTMSVLSAFGWHLIVKRFVLALIGATLTTVIFFQLANYIHLGYLDPFFIIAMFTSGLWAFVISVIVGAPFFSFRKKKES